MNLNKAGNLRYILRPEYLKESVKWFCRNPKRMRFVVPWLTSIMSQATNLRGDMPWITFEACEWLRSTLQPDMVTFEYGSGGSTLFFAKRVKHHTAIEHDREWYETVRDMLAKDHITNVDLRYVPLDTPGTDTYAAEIKKATGLFDLILIDGRGRNGCAESAKKMVKDGGYIILDNSDRTEYSDGMEMLSSFERTDYLGLGPRNPYIWQTTVFWNRVSYGLDGLDLKLEPYLAGIRDGFFVEAGANDGIKQSNTLLFEKRHGWHGLLVEAVPELAESCRHNRPKSIVENTALVSENFKDQTIAIRYGGLMSVVRGGMKTKEEEDAHVDAATRRKNVASYEISVPARTLSSVLEKHMVTKVDFLSLDVEGYELEALRGLDFMRWRPSYVLVEARYKDEIDSFMSTVGYSEVAKLSFHDYLYAPITNKP